MQVQAITMDAEKARELYRDYLTHAHYSAPIDDEIRQAYRLLSKGQLIINAIESVVKAGQDVEGFPKLALCRADADRCELSLWDGGRADMTYVGQGYRWNTNQRPSITFPPGSFPAKVKGFWSREALVPAIPIHLRPKRGRENYWILWEAEWRPAISADPYLLRRIGKSDMWVVVAMWDVTPIEKLALQTRIST